MKTPVARVSKQKLGWRMGLLIAGAIYILAMPLWEPVGLEGLILGRNDGRWWPPAALAAVALLVICVWMAISSRRNPDPTIFIQDGDLHFRHWKAPLPLSDVKRVQTFERDGSTRLQPMIVLTLRSGGFREIPYVVFDKDMISAATLIADAAGLSRRTDLQPDEPVTGP